MSYRGDYALGSNVDLRFTTRRFSTGAPFALAGTPVISAYPDNSTTQITAGITLTTDFDAVTGLNHVRVVATSGNGYAAGSTYDLVITTGTVDGVSVVGEVIGSFSIEGRSALRPTTAGRTLAVDAAGLGDANMVKVAGTAQTAGDILADTNDIQARLPAALVSGRMDSSVGAMAADVLTASALAAGAGNKVADHVLRRTYANARQSADGDAVNFRSLLGAIGKLVNKWAISGATLTVYQEDDATSTAPGGTQAITATAGADPITTLDTN